MALPHPTSSSYAVTVLPSGLEATVNAGECIVDGLGRSGWRLSYKCRRGGCGACTVRLLAGTVRYDHDLADTVLSAADIEDGACLPCRALPTSDVVIDVGAQVLRPVLVSNSPLRSTTTNATPTEARSTCQS